MVLNMVSFVTNKLKIGCQILKQFKSNKWAYYLNSTMKASNKISNVLYTCLENQNKLNCMITIFDSSQFGQVYYNFVFTRSIYLSLIVCIYRPYIETITYKCYNLSGDDHSLGRFLNRFFKFQVRFKLSINLTDF